MKQRVMILAAVLFVQVGIGMAQQTGNGMIDDYLVAWDYSGPYLDGDAFDIPFAPEQPDASQVEWKTLPTGLEAERKWVLHFDKIPYLAGNDRAIYLRTNVFSPVAQTVRLDLGSDDGIKGWLNGKLIHENFVARALQPDSDRKVVSLRRGWNLLLLKVSQGGGEWSACAALRKEDGSAVSGLRCEAGAPKIEVKMPKPKKILAPGKDYVEKYTGEYTGTLVLKGKKGRGLAQVIGEGRGRYRAVLMQGLWQTNPKLKQFRVELTGTLAEDGNIPLEGDGWSGTLVGQKTLTVKSDDGWFEGKWTVRKSPTLGAKPPQGAIVLLPFTKGKAPSLAQWSNKNWKTLKTGAMEVQGGNTFSVRKFGSAKFHVEFRCPYAPSKRGQGRGNSGVYLQSRYEVQVLDSFGLKSQANDCGSIYNVANTKVNACLPPLQWQTYDIEFQAAKTGADGKMQQPTITVYHNGILIHKDVKLPGQTTAAAASGLTPKDSLMLQDHGNKVQYRNIWVVERD